MTSQVQEARASLSRLGQNLNGDLSEVNTRTFLYSEVGTRNHPKYRQLQTNQELAGQFQASIVNCLNQHINHALGEQDGVLLFDMNYPEDHQLKFLPVNDNSTLQTWDSELPSDELDINFDENNQTFVSNIKYYAHSLYPLSEQRLMTFRYKRGIHIVRKDGIKAKLISGAYDYMQEHSLEFDHMIDCFLWEGNIFIRNNHFEQITKYKDHIIQIAEEVAIAACQFLPSGVHQDFIQTISQDYNLRRKAAGIHQSGHLSNVTIDAIQQHINNENLGNLLSIQQSSVGFQVQIDPNSKEQVRAYLRLLADDFWTSSMTGNAYCSASKTRR